MSMLSLSSKEENEDSEKDEEVLKYVLCVCVGWERGYDIPAERTCPKFKEVWPLQNAAQLECSLVLLKYQLIA